MEYTLSVGQNPIVLKFKFRCHERNNNDKKNVTSQIDDVSCRDSKCMKSIILNYAFAIQLVFQL